MRETKKMINYLLKRVDESQIGRPITDSEINKVRKEIKLYESSLILYFVLFMIAIIIAVI